MGLNFEVLRRSGAWFYYGEDRLGQGRDNVKQLLTDNPELAKEIEDKIMAKYNAAFSGEDAEADEPITVTPVDSADLEPKRASKKIDIDIAVDD